MTTTTAMTARCEAMYPDPFPLDRPSWCMDCGTKLDYDRDKHEELCGACYKVRLDDPCPDCKAGSGEDCLLSCGSRLV